MFNLFFCSDHGGLEIKTKLVSLFEKIHTYDSIKDLGVFNKDSCDYPDIVDTVIPNLIQEENTKAIITCGTGIGVSIRANRYKNIRAALVYDPLTAKMASAHNNANIICLGGRNLQARYAYRLIEIWLNTPFEQGRHIQRIAKLDQKLNIKFN